ncbi:MAG: hypothetical protein WCH35_16500 [Comamonadaceae bacterium]
MQTKDSSSMALTDSAGARSINSAAQHGAVRGALRSLFEEWMLAWQERHHTARVSKELLALYRIVAADHPGLTDRELFKLVVMKRNGCDSRAAETILESAEESFAQWPASCELTFCDVVHYLSVTEFLASHQREHWIHNNMASVVASHVPRDLCIARVKH